MKRMGSITYRWVNGFDVVPTLPPTLPGMVEPFQQLPADQTLWRTGLPGGGCAKAAGPLLRECLDEADISLLGGGGRWGLKRAKPRGERCTFVLSDHRMFKMLGALGACAADAAGGRGDACAAGAVRGLMPAGGRA
jgi:hypothetical protein